ncbi:MAG: glutaredoxin family protein [Ardenticatenaceae bacterium]|nr:glutaredoxin family protein [Ardenticatenaceae bacterium]MCB8988822.1 glutaredoxin family protein [Ardenticatenaceae bacterium]
MNEQHEHTETITLYTSSYCGHARLVEEFLAEENIAAEVINITENPAAREKLMELNAGYASVPTLVFADGSKLTEPSIRDLRVKLGLDSVSLGDRIRARLGRTMSGNA